MFGKKNQKLFYIVLMIALAAIFYYEHRKLDSNLEHIESDLTNEKNQKPAAQQKGINKIDKQVENVPAEESVPGNLQQVTPAFRTWFSDEAKNLEASIKNPAAKEALLKARAQQLTEVEISFLRKKATDTKATANERISAAYLLTLSNSASALAEIAQSPLSLASPQAVHSVGETLLAQEKSIRVIVIDELFNRAKADAALRNQLLATIEKISDEGLKQYALKCYRELK